MVMICWVTGTMVTREMHLCVNTKQYPALRVRVQVMVMATATLPRVQGLVSVTTLDLIKHLVLASL